MFAWIALGFTFRDYSFYNIQIFFFNQGYNNSTVDGKKYMYISQGIGII